MPSNGRFSLTPTLLYCSKYNMYGSNVEGETMFGPGWFSDFEICLESKTGEEGDLIYRCTTGNRGQSGSDALVKSVKIEISRF